MGDRRVWGAGRRFRRFPLAACAALLLIAGAGSADVLVTQDGTSLMTRGPWTVEGKVVRFHDEAGALRTLRLVDVDLDASQAATAEAAAKGAGADYAKGNTTAAAQSAASSPLAAAAASLKAARATGAPAALVLRDGDVAAADPAAIAAAKAGASRPPQLVLYGTSWCPWCKKERQLLAVLGVTWIEKDTEHTPGARDELLRLTGTTRVPVLVLGSRVIRGFQAEAIQQLAAEARVVEQAHAPEPAPERSP